MPSLTKAQVRRIRSLGDKRSREELGCFVVEGEKVVGELLASGYRFEEVYAVESHAGGLRVPHSVITTEEMGRISLLPTPSPLLAVGCISRPELDSDILAKGLTLALDGVQDPGNVGTLLRVADWYGFDRVLLSPDCADLFSQKVIQASMGSFSRVIIYTTELVEPLLASGVPVLGCDLSGADVHSVPPVHDAVVVIGSEGRGLSLAVRSAVTSFFTIPRYGLAESLNAAIAAAVVCDNLRRSLSAGIRPMRAGSRPPG